MRAQPQRGSRNCSSHSNLYFGCHKCDRLDTENIILRKGRKGGRKKRGREAGEKRGKVRGE